MAIDGIRVSVAIGIIAVSALLGGCGTVKEKAAPCKRPSDLSAYANDPRPDCGPMHAVNDPAAAFAALGLE
ncbi:MULTISPECIES: hypothetical protein [Neorhizobium]|uniref:hypothetical protein n=1 Tax=Neorhizobium TaxID=1525371 RepID=UPI00058A2C6D|nr:MULTISPECIES: hypothetical protein [Neorhizobium]MCJ9672798.1 hypothetical protein [Neorhizobium sp. SHOUNA12B]MCJ9748437.1 hypothetical protein [Neorhizobium sp. SHOUNA12A]